MFNQRSIILLFYIFVFNFINKNVKHFLSFLLHSEPGKLFNGPVKNKGYNVGLFYIVVNSFEYFCFVVAICDIEHDVEAIYVNYVNC